MSETIDVLFFGDIVGKPGREAVKRYLAHLTDRPEVVIANVENISHGFGILEKHYHEMIDAGVDILTGGNHSWDRKEIFDWLPMAGKLLRPHNLSTDMPGTGAKVFEVNGLKIGVMNLMGQTFMGNYNSPWEVVETLLPDMAYETNLLFLDFHAEATSEKVAMGHFGSRYGLSAFSGTHTHVQTADDRILNNQTGYITDSGCNGSYDSVIGMEINGAVDRIRSHGPRRLEIGPEHRVQVNGTRYTLSTQTGACVGIQRVNEVLTMVNA